MTSVLKIGGNQLDDPAFIAGMAQAVKRMAETPVIVHGGGKAIKSLQQKFGIEPRTIGGLRVTDNATMELVTMALCGQANVMLVAALTNAGVEAQGYNGADRGLLRAQRMTHPDGDLGRVGQIVAVRGDVIREALAAKVVPVIAPVSLGEDGGFYNVNADQAAGAVAAGINAEQVIFLTDVPGVLHQEQRLDQVSQAQARDLIATGVAKDGMAVKLEAALNALSGGVRRAVITNLSGLEQGIGTVVSI
jgi:acetylglutamate kinase